MVRSWIEMCGLRSIDHRRLGFVPHSRLFRDSVNYALTKQHVLERMDELGYSIRFEETSSDALKEATRNLFQWITDTGEVTEPWTCFTVDRKKNPTVLFAFQNAGDAVRAKLVF